MNGTESKLLKFIDNLNQKHPTIKFEFNYSRTSINFLDTKVYTNENGTLFTTIYRKPSDRRNFLHYKSAHLKALKDNITHSQALRIKRICSETSEVIKHLKDLKDTSIKRGYQSKVLDHQFERAMSMDRKILLENKKKPSTQGNLPLVLMCLSSTKHSTLKMLLIDIGIFNLSTKIYIKFLIKNVHGIQKKCQSAPTNRRKSHL